MNTVIVEKILKKPDFENHPATTAVWQKKKVLGAQPLMVMEHI